MNPAGRTGLLGGTFDPIHKGHLDAARAAADALELERVLIIPSRMPPHRPSTPVASSHHRFAMVAIAALSDPRLRACDIEVGDHGPSYTSQTLRRLTESGYDRSHLYFITGADAFADIASWKDYPVLLDHAHFVVISRPGAPAGELPARMPGLGGRMVDAASFLRDPARSGATAARAIILIDVPTSSASSTAIRRRLGIGEPVSEWLPADVERYLRRHELYTSSRPASGLHGQA